MLREILLQEKLILVESPVVEILISIVKQVALKLQE